MYETGGGGLIAYKNTLVDSCVIAGNISYTGDFPSGGGGLLFTTHMVSASVTNSTISDNVADGAGGIFYFGINTVSMAYCEISGNQALQIAGGVYFASGSTIIDHCTVSGNVASGGDGGGFYFVNDVDVSNSIFSWNSPDAIRRGSAGTLEYSDFFGNTQNISGNIPTGFNVLDTVNYNGDSCDVYFNIFMDPMFEDTAIGDYHLTVGSPCIDAGDPAFAYDPDSTITDIGAYYFDQRAPDIVVSDSLLDFGTVMVGQQANLPIMIYNIGNGDLILLDMTNSLPVFTNDWNPVDSIILPGDSLQVMVTFAPDDSIAFTDTLWIDNSDELTHVQFLGEGLPATGIVEDSPHAVKEPFDIQYLNPSISPGRIRFTLPKSCEVALSLHDVTGRLVATLASGWHEVGSHEVNCDAAKFSQGVYFLRLEAGGTTIRKKLILFR
jgi:hypothetical protein